MARKTKKAETSTPEAETAAESDGPSKANATAEGIEDAEIIEDIPPAPEPEATPDSPADSEPEPKAAAVITFPDGWPWADGGDDSFQADAAARLDALDSALAGVRSELANAPDIGATLAPVTDQVDALGGSLQGLASDLAASSARLDTIEARLTALEKRPITESVSPAAIAAYEAEVKALQQAMATQRAEIEKLAAEAIEKEASADETAHQAITRAAVSRILTALDAGTGFADAADALTSAGIALPPVLAEAAEGGVVTRANLAEAFPEAARAALAVARKAESDRGLTGFLKSQLGARSLEPRDGDDPDAVLSRAEAAVREGRLADAIAEIDTLPEAARAEMSDWLARATTRREALAAAETLAADLN